MWGALRGNGLIRTFHVGIRCSSLKMREKVHWELCFLDDVIFWSWKALAILRAWQQEYQRCLKPVGTIKDSTKGRHVSYVPALLCASSRERGRKSTIWNVESSVQSRRTSNHQRDVVPQDKFQHSSSSPPSWNFPPLRDPFRLSCLGNERQPALPADVLVLLLQKQSRLKCSGELTIFQVKTVIIYQIGKWKVWVRSGDFWISITSSWEINTFCPSRGPVASSHLKSHVLAQGVSSCVSCSLRPQGPYVGH